MPQQTSIVCKLVLTQSLIHANTQFSQYQRLWSTYSYVSMHANTWKDTNTHCSSVCVQQGRFAVIEPVLLFCKQTRSLKVHLWLHLHLKDFGSRLSEIPNSVWWCLLPVWHNYIKHNFSIANSSSCFQCLKTFNSNIGNTRKISRDVSKWICWIPKASRSNVFGFIFDLHYRLFTWLMCWDN